jgi:hypothetical protein
MTLLERHPPEHLEAWGRGFGLQPRGSLAFFDLMSGRANYGPQTGPYVILGGYHIGGGYSERTLTFSSTTLFDPGDGGVIKLGLELPGVGVRAVGRVVAFGLELAPAWCWYGYTGTLTRLSDSATRSVEVSATFFSLTLDAHLCLGGNANGRYGGYCLVAAPILAIWSPGDPAQWNAGITLGLRLAVM